MNFIILKDGRNHNGTFLPEVAQVLFLTNQIKLQIKTLNKLGMELD